MDRRGYRNVYTDGACSNNGYDGARAGMGVYWGPSDSRNVSAPVYGRQTNNTAEIRAATRALEQAKASGYTRVAINTDSDFMIKCQTQWKDGWKQNNWTRSNGEPVKNSEDLQRLDNASRGMDVVWKHVPAHSGVRGNVEADRLAKAGARMHQ